jgi:hypothetical protein
MGVVVVVIVIVVVVVIKAENGRVAAAYNEDGFSSGRGLSSPNLNGFIVSVDGDGGCGEIFNRNDLEVGVLHYPDSSPAFGSGDGPPDLDISKNCHQNESSWSSLGCSYGRGSGLNI